MIGGGLKYGTCFGVWVEWISKRQSPYKYDINDKSGIMWSGQESFPVNSQSIIER